MDFAAPQVQKLSDTRYVVSHGSDANVVAEFFMDAVLQEYESSQAGHPVYRDVAFVRLSFPGDRTKTFVGLATEEHQQRFPRQWEAFVRQGIQAHEGVPLSEWPVLAKSEVLGLKAANIHTVEQLAALPDSALSGMGWRLLRNKAVAWLENAKDGSAVTKLLQQIEELKAHIQTLEHGKQLTKLGREREGLEGEEEGEEEDHPARRRTAKRKK